MNNTVIDFDFERIAQGYRRRPYLHKQVIERFRQEVSSRMFENGLDVGCGAGLSTKALKMICDHVTGIDASAEMIAVAKEVCGNAEGYDFAVSRAETLPDFDTKFDIVTAAGVVQWVDRKLFLQGLQDKIKRGGYLLVYDFGISDRMKDSAAYTNWWHDEYLKEFPKPYRDESVWTGEETVRCGFMMLDQVRYEMDCAFERDAFIEFMMIQSNVNAKIEGGLRSAAEVEAWFRQSVRPFFREGQGEKRTVIFTGYSWYLQRM